MTSYAWSGFLISGNGYAIFAVSWTSSHGFSAWCYATPTSIASHYECGLLAHPFAMSSVMYACLPVYVVPLAATYSRGNHHHKDQHMQS